jgi:hypothetical protein
MRLCKWKTLEMTLKPRTRRSPITPVVHAPRMFVAKSSSLRSRVMFSGSLGDEEGCGTRMISAVVFSSEPCCEMDSRRVVPQG